MSLIVIDPRSQTIYSDTCGTYEIDKDIPFQKGVSKIIPLWDCVVVGVGSLIDVENVAGAVCDKTTFKEPFAHNSCVYVVLPNTEDTLRIIEFDVVKLKNFKLRKWLKSIFKFVRIYGWKTNIKTISDVISNGSGTRYFQGAYMSNGDILASFCITSKLDTMVNNNIEMCKLEKNKVDNRYDLKKVQKNTETS